MRILISNDDGIYAPGILALADVMRELGDVFVVAPHQQKSASSHAISMHQGLYVDEVDLKLRGVTAYSVTGTPVDCVKWGIVMLGDGAPFDLVLTGINEGANLATDVLYSGTVAAAGEGCLQGIPSIAFSLVGPDFPYDIAANVALDVTKEALCWDLPPDTFLNVNIPSAHLAKAKIVVTELGARGYENRFIMRTDATGKPYYHHAGEELQETGGRSTDVVALQNRHISITPIQYRFTNFSAMDALVNVIQQQSTNRK